MLIRAKKTKKRSASWVGSHWIINRIHQTRVTELLPYKTRNETTPEIVVFEILSDFGVVELTSNDKTTRNSRGFHAIGVLFPIV